MRGWELGLYRISFIIILVLAIALGLLIGALNHEIVNVDLLWVQLTWPLGLTLLAALVIGLLVGMLLAWLVSVLPLRLQLRKARKSPYSGGSFPDGLND